MTLEPLTQRERQVLEAVIHMFVDTAEPAGSRTIAKRFNLGVSAATIRNTMSDLEDRGYLYHPHTSAGRIPTDLAYRVYVDALMAPTPPSPVEQARLREELSYKHSAIESLLGKAAEVLGVLTSELGVAVAPSMDVAVLERLELIEAASDRLLMVLVLKGGLVRTIFVEVQDRLPRQALSGVAQVLNERLSGLTLKEIRFGMRDRLRDATADGSKSELLNILIEEAEQLFEVGGSDSELLMGSTRMLAGQPEFNSNEQMRNLLGITEQRDLLVEALRARKEPGITVTIGSENVDPQLSSFTIVTSTFRSSGFRGTIGVMGPTRMPYRKVVAMVGHTSRLVGDLLSREPST